MVSLIPILVSPSAKVLAQEQQWVTYENPYFGISIQHPPNWEVKSSNTDNSPPPPGFAKEIVELSSAPAPDTNDTSGLKIQTAIAESSLDTETMQLKNATLEDFVEGKKSEIISLAIPSGELAKLDFQKQLIRDNKTTVGGLPAWKIESIDSILGRQGTYHINTFVMKDGRLFDLEFTTDSLKAPEMIPINQRMIDSFRVTTPPAPVSTPNITETADSLSQPSPQFPPMLDSDILTESAPISEPGIGTEEGIFQDDEDDSETVEDENNDNEE
jgi:hypothetical protein